MSVLQLGSENLTAKEFNVWFIESLNLIYVDAAVVDESERMQILKNVNMRVYDE